MGKNHREFTLELSRQRLPQVHHNKEIISHKDIGKSSPHIDCSLDTSTSFNIFIDDAKSYLIIKRVDRSKAPKYYDHHLL